jgi:hypothetical protein
MGGIVELGRDAGVYGALAERLIEERQLKTRLTQGCFLLEP